MGTLFLDVCPDRQVAIDKTVDDIGENAGDIGLVMVALIGKGALLASPQGIETQRYCNLDIDHH